MKIFLSWSGDQSREIAKALRDWLPNVIQALDPWMSSEDIAKGARWSSDIASELAATKAGILCLTPDNLGSAWLNFEAGALSKTVDKSFVCPYLVGLKPSDLSGPLVQFQATAADKNDTRQLLATLNSALGVDALPEPQLDKTYEKWWPELSQALERLQEEIKLPGLRRSEREILEELLELVRAQSRRAFFYPDYSYSPWPDGTVVTTGQIWRRDEGAGTVNALVKEYVRKEKGGEEANAESQQPGLFRILTDPE